MNTLIYVTIIFLYFFKLLLSATSINLNIDFLFVEVFRII